MPSSCVVSRKMNEASVVGSVQASREEDHLHGLACVQKTQYISFAFLFLKRHWQHVYTDPFCAKQDINRSFLLIPELRFVLDVGPVCDLLFLAQAHANK